MTSTDPIIVSQEGRVLRIALNRPHERNTITGELSKHLIAAIERGMTDPGVGALLLEGAGERDFCAGGSMTGLADHGAAALSLEERTATATAATRAATLLVDGPKPSVAAMRGATAGGGLVLAAACDVRVAAKGARIGFAYARIGLSGDFGACWVLSRLMGPRFNAFALLSPVVGPEEAHALGLVNEVVEPEDLNRRAMEIAIRLAAIPPQVAAGLKQNIAAARDLTPAQALAIEARNFAQCQLDPNHAEAVMAFVQKREASLDYDATPVLAPWSSTSP
jgi:2-(1,2-epoxy-1,2-dihydrophenyl)acetyl-CoA isomerase